MLAKNLGRKEQEYIKNQLRSRLPVEEALLIIGSEEPLPKWLEKEIRQLKSKKGWKGVSA